MPTENDLNITFTRSTEAHVEIDSMIGNPPGWLLQSGISALALVTLIILTGSWFFKYPDKLVGIGTLTSTAPPIEIVSRTSGYIESLEVSEGDYVNKGDALIFINNTTDQNQLNALIEWIAQYVRIEDPTSVVRLPFIDSLQLGAIQGDYARLQLKYNEYHQVLKDGITFQLIDNIKQEILKIKSLNQSQRKEKDIFKQELDIANKDFDRFNKLNSDGAVSDIEKEQTNTAMLQKRRQFESMNNSIIQNNIRIEQLKLEQLKLQNQRAQKLQGYQFEISEIIARIQTSIQNWNETYIVKAPLDGYISFLKEITLQKNLTLGQQIGHIIPEENQQNYISAVYPSLNIGKVEGGQQVIIKFNEYPYKEYGVVNAKVGEVSKMPEKSEQGEVLYEIRIPLEEIIKTDYDEVISYRPNMTAVVDIITEDKTVFERVFDQLLSLTNN
ncbi:MAG: HlyD family efflux transporter periplasmic adaptor subunit [Saprospiraceae bacterium]|nr:HlyD family efflux transporter periplasmic adaptor subunit [Saprospiraceae bacterium]